MKSFVHYIPLLTTVIAIAFAFVLFQRWNKKRTATYLLWWAIGVTMYGVGTLAEGLTTLFGWSEWVFRIWYVSGALLGGFPLAQGTAYLLLSKKAAWRLTAVFVTFIVIASICVLLSPIDMSLVEPFRLSGRVMSWQWVRMFSPFVNLYSFIMLVGGAIWSAWLYWKQSHEMGSRVLGNIAIAVGGLLPGIGGSFARMGQVEVLYVTELLGLILIWFGYQVMVADSVISVHWAQRRSQTQTA